MKELIIFMLIGWMLTAIAATEEYGSREVAIQDTVSGVDSSYVHGAWCVDSRSF